MPPSLSWPSECGARAGPAPYCREWEKGPVSQDSPNRKDAEKEQMTECPRDSGGCLVTKELGEQEVSRDFLLEREVGFVPALPQDSVCFPV